MGTTRQKSSCRNRLQNGPRLLSRVKAGTHSPSPTGSHTAAYTPKQGPSGRGRYYYSRSVSHVSETLRGQVSERQTLPFSEVGCPSLIPALQNVLCFSGTAAVHAKQPRFPVKGTGAVFASLHIAIQEGRNLAAGAGGVGSKRPLPTPAVMPFSTAQATACA